MVMRHDLYYELGRLGVPWEQVEVAIKLVHDRANVQHTMGARGYAELFKGSESTGKRLCYDSGTDGMDDKYWIEDVPKHTLHLEMNDEEWESLRRTIWADPRAEPFVAEHRSKGTFGAMPPPVMLKPAVPSLAEVFSPKPPQTHLVCAGMGPGQWRCSCGHRWTSLHKNLGPYPCPADPKHVPCR